MSSINCEEKPNWPASLIGTLTFLLPVFFFVVGGWASSLLILIFALSLICVIAQHREYFVGRSAQFWCYLICLSAPFLTEMANQLLRWEFKLSALDGPSRFLASAVIFTFVSKNKAGCCFARFRPGLTLCIFVTVPFLLIGYYLYPDTFFYKWNQRLAPQFGDPNTFGVFLVLILGFSQLPIWLNAKPFSFRFATSVIFLPACIYLVVLSGSRTAYFTLIIFFVSLLVFGYAGSTQKLPRFLLVPLIVLALFSLSHEYFGARIAEILHDLDKYKQGQLATSTGQRIELFVFELDLIKQYPYLGVQEGWLPGLHEVNQWAPYVTADFYSRWITSGSHSGIFVHLSSKGILLGGISLIALYVYPFIIFVRRIKIENQELSFIFSASAALVVSLFFASFGIQVLNLKMNSSMYSFFLAIMFSFTLMAQEQSPRRG